ncbi:hypothetical protein H312_00696, partial [Anncaliia algerae PRA339]
MCQKIHAYYNIYPVKLGGLGNIVHVDETKLNFNVKSHQSYGPIDPCWAIVITDTSFKS